MLTQIESLIKELANKPTWSAKELIPKLESTSVKISSELETSGKILNVTSSKKKKVGYIKKYDILYLPLVGFPHYFMVHKIIDENVYGIIFTTNEKPAITIHLVEHDRNLMGSYASSTYFCVSMNEAKDSFIRIYENKAEADMIFKKVSILYRKLFKHSFKK
jgi:hypothetical protein